MAACFKVDRTRELINTHQPLMKTDFFFYSRTIPDPYSAGAPARKGSGHARLGSGMLRCSGGI